MVVSLSALSRTVFYPIFFEVFVPNNSKYFAKQAMNSLSKNEKLLTCGALLLLVITALLLAIPQDQAYPHFADTRALLGVPLAAASLSNLGFLGIGCTAPS